MNRDLFLIIDMQNAYDKNGVWACQNFERAKNNIKEVLEKGKEMDVVFTKFVAPSNPIGTWKRYNSINHEVNESVFENELILDFQPYLEQYPIHLKSTYSCLSNLELLELCQKAKRVVVSGVVAECCVLATVMGCIDEGIDVVYLSDAVAGVNDACEEATIMILKGLEYAQVSIMDTSTYLRGESV